MPSSHGVSCSHERFTGFNLWLRSNDWRPAANKATLSYIKAGSVCHVFVKFVVENSLFIQIWIRVKFTCKICSPTSEIDCPFGWNFFICSTTSATLGFCMSTKRKAVILTLLYLKSSKSNVSMSFGKSNGKYFLKYCPG